MKNAPIGIFDSGIGGLTMANAIKKFYQMRILFISETQNIFLMEKNLKNLYRTLVEK